MSLGKVVAQRDVADAEELAVVDEEIRELVVDVGVGHARDLVARSLTGPAVEDLCGVVGGGAPHIAIALHDLIAGLAVGGHGEVEAFVVEAQREAEGEVRHAVAEVDLIGIVDLAVVVDVVVFHVAGLGISLQHTIAVGDPVLDLLLVLEDTRLSCSPRNIRWAHRCWRGRTPKSCRRA